MNKQETVFFTDWAFSFSQNLLEHAGNGSVQRLEPKVSELLWVLLSREQQVVTKEELMSELWPDTVVGDDTLARTISRLRAALSDSARHPRYIETIPKRGYRFMAEVRTESTSARRETRHWPPVIALLGFGLLILSAAIVWLRNSGQDLGEWDETLERADALYMRFEQQSNEAAFALYERVLETDRSNSRARAGMANVIVQRLVRWPSAPHDWGDAPVSLTAALRKGQLDSKEARLSLAQAQLLAEQAAASHPEDVQIIKALGFVYSAQGQLGRAIDQYGKAIQLSPNAWRSMINLAELLEYQGQPEASLAMYIQAFYAMQKAFSDEPQIVEPWQPQLGNLIAERYLAMGDYQKAKTWAQRVLDLVPFDRQAATTLVSSLLVLQELAAASEYCQAYAPPLKPLKVCL